MEFYSPTSLKNRLRETPSVMKRIEIINEASVFYDSKISEYKN
jgi:hypothetical protein|tara:strand:- start:424 stop:552 length:129 start_codon:yes stop_codon:yes gene_type:complete